MNKKFKNWMKIAIGLIIVVILFANPTSRAIIQILLPMGSGVDDIIEMVALGGLAILLIYKLKKNWTKIKYWFKEDEWN